MKHLSVCLLWIAIVYTTLLSEAVASAPFVLTFNQLKYDEPIGSYYEGGQAGLGSGPGPDFGASFPSHALAFPGDNWGSRSILYWTDSGIPNIVINVADGFATGFAMNYSSDVPGELAIYDGLNATGNRLARVRLADLNYGPLDSVGVSFSGIARSVVLGDDADLIVFDNLTFGRTQPGVPEPASAILVAIGLAALTLRRRRLAM